MTITGTGRRHLRRCWVMALALTAVVVGGGAAAALSGGHGGLPLVFALLALAALMLPYAAFVSTSLVRDARLWLRREPSRVFWVPLFVFAVYLVYALGTGSFSSWGAARLAAFVLVPTALLYAARGRDQVTWQDWVAVLAIWLPFDTGLLKAIWTWPAGEGAYILNTALAVDLAVVLFVGLRRFEGVSIRFHAGWRDLGLAAAGLLGFMAVALPVGFLTEFIAWKPKPLDLAKLMGTPLGIFFFIAVPEELLFRGLVQNLLQKRLGHPRVALVLASVFFGATHLNNEPLLDWRYFALATVAGFFYGWTYMRSRSLLVPALVHAAVDTLWVWFFLV